MKRITLSILTLSLAMNSMAQDAADKEVQAGLVFGSGLAFQKMGTNYMASNGTGTDLTIGANATFSLTETIGFCTGLEFDFETLKYKSANYQDNGVYYYYIDKDILSLSDYDPNNANHNLFELDTRRQKAVYLTIPTMMVFRTNFIGYFRYFGKFGLRNSFLLKSSISDTGNDLTPEDPMGIASAATLDNMSASGEMFFFKSAVGLSGGAEWNFSGSTSLVAEIGYYYGFTPIHTAKNVDKGNNYYFATAPNNGAGNDTRFNNKATQSQLQLKISILF
ncbi:MAG: hypothetical protein EP305_12605 [Bacteroidetes bacterium]|nr:MAG: hypothetical protein EP305_12605 [Bacteroidota bacterium]